MPRLPIIKEFCLFFAGFTRTIQHLGRTDSSHWRLPVSKFFLKLHLDDADTSITVKKNVALGLRAYPCKGGEAPFYFGR